MNYSKVNKFSKIKNSYLEKDDWEKNKYDDLIADSIFAAINWNEFDKDIICLMEYLFYESGETFCLPISRKEGNYSVFEFHNCIIPFGEYHILDEETYLKEYALYLDEQILDKLILITEFINHYLLGRDIYCFRSNNQIKLVKHSLCSLEDLTDEKNSNYSFQICKNNIVEPVNLYDNNLYKNIMKRSNVILLIKQIEKNMEFYQMYLNPGDFELEYLNNKENDFNKISKETSALLGNSKTKLFDKALYFPLKKEVHSNKCLICKTEMGPQNPRQLCGKTYCKNISEY